MYKALITFRDLEDGHLYNTGDPFPHDGREVKPERLESLLSAQNLTSQPVIMREEEEVQETEQRPKKRARAK